MKRHSTAELGLIADAIETGKPIPAMPEVPHRRNEESWAQKQLIIWWGNVCSSYNLEPHDLFSIPNQLASSARNASRMKDEGLRAGVADLFLMVPRNDYHGLYLELKAPNGRIAPSQTEFMKRAIKRGYAHAFCYTLRDAQAVITFYLK